MVSPIAWLNSGNSKIALMTLVVTSTWASLPNFMSLPSNSGKPVFGINYDKCAYGILGAVKPTPTTHQAYPETTQITNFGNFGPKRITVFAHVSGLVSHYVYVKTSDILTFCCYLLFTLLNYWHRSWIFIDWGIKKTLCSKDLRKKWFLWCYNAFIFCH